MDYDTFFALMIVECAKMKQKPQIRAKFQAGRHHTYPIKGIKYQENADGTSIVYLILENKDEISTMD